MNTSFPLLKASPVRWSAAALLTLALAIAVSTPNLLRSRIAAEKSAVVGSALRTVHAAESDHKIVQTGSMDLIVKGPAETSDRIRKLAEQSGGFVMSVDTSEAGQDSIGSVAISIPVKKFDEVRAGIHALGVRVESERLEGKDVTKQYIDEAARLRNLRARETQYLSIMKQAKTIKDILEVSAKLDEVRTQIEQGQAEFDALSKQADMVALTVLLRADSEAQVFGLHWRPLYQLKLAVRDGLDAVGVYAGVMASIVFYLPAAILWLATIFIGAAAGWRAFRWAGRTLFVEKSRPA